MASFTSDALQVTSAFDSGNVEVDEIDAATHTISARIRAEPFTEGTDKKQHRQWFHFRVANVTDALTVRLTNAGYVESPATLHQLSLYVCVCVCVCVSLSSR